MAEVAATGETRLGLEYTEEEPDDDFRPEAAGRAPPEKAGHEDDEGAEAEELPLPVLSGPWHQLEGVPRPLAAGPRYLAWNDHGHLVLHSEHHRIEVHHQAQEKPQKVVDHAGLEMGAISRSISCLAAGAGASGGSRLLIRPAERWEKASFSAFFGSADEAPEAIACGEGFVAALTSRRFLRLYSATGLPLCISSLPGHGVALAARGSLLLAVFRPGAEPPADGDDDFLEYRLLDVSTHVQRSAGRLPLSSGARLRWLGLSAELVPIAIDTEGVVRALLGTGLGAWGPPGGGGGQWAPVLELKEEEARVGPLWTVHVKNGVMFCAEVGLEGLEPQPRQMAEASGNVVEGLAPTEEPAPFGCGGVGKLRELPWRLPVGPMSVASAAVEEVLRERLLARHLEELSAAAVLPESEAAEDMDRSYKKKVLRLFGQLVKSGDEERALDVARTSLALGAALTKLLGSAQAFAERAGSHRLADEIAALPRVVAEAPAANTAPTPRAVAAEPARPVQAVPRATQRELPPLFQPGEFEEDVAKTPEATGTPPRSELTASVPSAPQSQAATPPPRTDAAAAGVAATPPPASAGPPQPAPTGGNPFARKRKAPGVAQAPHLLRDALGVGIRRPATPAAGGEQPAKAAKVAAATLPPKTTA